MIVWHFRVIFTKFIKNIVRGCLILITWHTLCYGNWTFPGFNRPLGFWESSVGVHAWSDHIVGRNLQFRHTTYLHPGLRLFTTIRGNKKFDKLTPLSPQFDEQFIEHLGFYRSNQHLFAYSIKGGKIRYLRFPYPDRISMFDQVPGTEDLQNRHQTGYAGIIGIWEYEYRPVGIGHHLTTIQWMGNQRRDASVLENYLFMRRQLGPLFWESRLGRLAVRPEPLGKSEWGHVSYLGIRKWRYEIGFLIENLENNPIYTGVMVQFALSPFTKAFGAVHFDYTRSPEGAVMQIPFWKGYWGVANIVPDNATYIGELKTERSVTYWQNGQGRNFYEHTMSNTIPHTKQKNTVVVVEEGPWHLKLESLVSPHSSFRNWNDLKEWERKRQGPAQLAQHITYKVYQIASPLK